MSTSPFGQPPAFGAPVSPQQEPPVAEEPRPRGRTALVAAAAGVAALAVLGTAAMVLGGDPASDDLATAPPPAAVSSVEPSVAPTTPVAAPLPTSAVRGRNIFVPLVEPETPAASETMSAAPAATPTTSSVTSLSGDEPGSTAPLRESAPTVTETVPAPPSASEPQVVEVAVPDFHSLSVALHEDLPEYPADFTLVVDEGDEPEVFEHMLPGVKAFGPERRLEYVDFDPKTRTLTIRYVDSVYNVSVPPPS